MGLLPPGAGIGIDIVQMSRIERLQHDKRFLERVFTPGEIEDAGDGPQRAARLAARWAAKEATAKALGCGIGGELSFQDVEIVHNAHGAPLLRLSGEASLRHHHPQFSVSLSHDGDYAIAAVWILGHDVDDVDTEG